MIKKSIIKARAVEKTLNEDKPYLSQNQGFTYYPDFDMSEIFPKITLTITSNRFDIY